MSPEEHNNKVQRIEDAVIKLEKDMAIMSDAVTRTAKAVETLAEVRTETQVLRNDYKHYKDTCDLAVKAVKEDTDALRKEVKDLRDRQASNTYAVNAVSRFSWLLIGGAVTFFYWLLTNISSMLGK